MRGSVVVDRTLCPFVALIYSVFTRSCMASILDIHEVVSVVRVIDLDLVINS